MSDEKEKTMSFAMKDIPLGGEPVKFKLDCATAVKTGESQYGTWYLWFAYVENISKVKDRDNGNKTVENYTGKISFFPTEILNKKLEDMCAGNINVEVAIKKVAEEGRKGLITQYVPEKLSDGEKIDANMTATETKLVQDCLTLKKTAGISLDKADFVKAALAPIYEGKITKERAEALFGIMQRMS